MQSAMPAPAPAPASASSASYPSRPPSLPPGLGSSAESRGIGQPSGLSLDSGSNKLYGNSISPFYNLQSSSTNSTGMGMQDYNYLNNMGMFGGNSSTSSMQSLGYFAPSAQYNIPSSSSASSLGALGGHSTASVPLSNTFGEPASESQYNSRFLNRK